MKNNPLKIPIIIRNGNGLILRYHLYNYRVRLFFQPFLKKIYTTSRLGDIFRLKKSFSIHLMSKKI